MLQSEEGRSVYGCHVPPTRPISTPPPCSMCVANAMRSLISTMQHLSRGVDYISSVLVRLLVFRRMPKVSSSASVSEKNTAGEAFEHSHWIRPHGKLVHTIRKSRGSTTTSEASA